MNIYRISQTANRGYDTYDSAVVIAEDHEQARLINPAYNEFNADIYSLFMDEEGWAERWSGWAHSPEDVLVEYIGTAAPGSKVGVVCASFNAG